MNHWSTFRSSIISWNASFSVENKADVFSILDCVKHIIEIGEKEMVYEVWETKGSPPFHRNIDTDFFNFEKKRVLDSKFLSFFTGPVAAITKDGINVVNSLINFYENEEIKVEKISNLGKLQKKLIELHSIQVSNFIYEIMPLTIECLNQIDINSILNNVSTSPKTFYISISLYTDIWFPKIIDIMNENYPNVMIENDLAILHTPRLNNFLQEVKNKVLQQKGTWYIEFGDILGDCYSNLVNENGIIL